MTHYPSGHRDYPKVFLGVMTLLDPVVIMTLPWSSGPFCGHHDPSVVVVTVLGVVTGALAGFGWMLVAWCARQREATNQALSSLPNFEIELTEFQN